MSTPGYKPIESQRLGKHCYTQISNAYSNKGLVESVPSPVQIPTQTLEGVDIMFLQAGPFSLTGVVTGLVSSNKNLLCVYADLCEGWTGHVRSFAGTEHLPFVPCVMFNFLFPTVTKG